MGGREGWVGLGGRRRMCTPLVSEDVASVHQPRFDGDVIGNVGRNGAANDNAVAADDALHVDVGLVRLVHHYPYDSINFKISAV